MKRWSEVETMITVQHLLSLNRSLFQKVSFSRDSTLCPGSGHFSCDHSIFHDGERWEAECEVIGPSLFLLDNIHGADLFNSYASLRMIDTIFSLSIHTAWSLLMMSFFMASFSVTSIGCIFICKETWKSLCEFNRGLLPVQSSRKLFGAKERFDLPLP